jgi:hypothetical protein
MQQQQALRAETNSTASVRLSHSPSHEILNALEQLVTHLAMLCSEFENLLNQSRELRYG